VLLLHGFTLTGRVCWNPHLGAFGRDYRVILPDLRGHGRSGNPAGPAAMNHRQFARDIAGLCRWLEIDRAAFCGYSAGAMLQLSLALEEPRLVAASVLISGSTCFPEATQTVMRSKTADQLAYE
jgi:pimeloyl-ACP methyl ester carboxylesterase